MLRNEFRARTTAVLLMVILPFMFAIMEATSLGSAPLPLMWGWAIAAHAVVQVDVRSDRCRGRRRGDDAIGGSVVLTCRSTRASSCW